MKAHTVDATNCGEQAGKEFAFVVNDFPRLMYNTNSC